MTDEPNSGQGYMLVVDDNKINRGMLTRALELQGHRVATAEHGVEALERLHDEAFDMVLLDILMPEMDGYETLEAMKADSALRHIPVIMISALDEMESVVRCIARGAEDYLPKPFDPVLLQARIGACLEKKRLRDREMSYLRQIEREKKRSDDLLHVVLPHEIVQEIQSKRPEESDGEEVALLVEPKHYEDVTILFTDFVGFTLSAEKLAAEDLVHRLHDYFTAFDQIAKRYGLEKLKTIGDSYMCVGGLWVRDPSHPVDVVLAAFEMLAAVAERNQPNGPVSWSVRIGVHTGSVSAGVVGIHKYQFDVWGDSVNYASRVESSGAPNRINLSDRTYSRVKDFFECEFRGKVLTKEMRESDMYFCTGILPELLEEDRTIIPPPAFARRYRTYFQKDPPTFPSNLALPGPESALADQEPAASTLPVAANNHKAP